MALIRGLRKTVVRFITLVAGFLGIAMLLYIPYVLWETYRVNELCADIKSGMKVEALPELVEKYGFKRHYVERKGYADKNGYRNIFVPTNSSVGDYGCEIVHDGNRVISAYAPR